MSEDDGYRNQYGFGREQHNGRGTYWCFGPDKQNAEDSHSSFCQFIRTSGSLPCGCDYTRRSYTPWWYNWMRWSKAHMEAHSNTKFPIKWPREGADGSPWIEGIDFE